MQPTAIPPRLRRLIVVICSTFVVACGGAEYEDARRQPLQGNEANPTPQTYNKDDLYRFFAVAFGAAPGQTYMGQLIEAAEHGLSIRQIVNIFTTKPQFQETYPDSLSDLNFAEMLVANVVRDSASSTSKSTAIKDIVDALTIAKWSRGDVIYTIFSNLASKPYADQEWGRTAKLLGNWVSYSKYFTEDLKGDSTELEVLKEVINSVSHLSDTRIQAIEDHLFTVAHKAIPWNSSFREVVKPSPDISEALVAVHSNGPSASTLIHHVAADFFNEGKNSVLLHMWSYPDGCTYDPLPACLSTNPYVMRDRLILLRSDQDGQFRNVTSEAFGTNSVSVGGGSSNIRIADINGDGVPDIVIAGNQDHVPIGDPITNQFGQSAVLLSKGPGKFEVHRLGPRGFYEDANFIFLEKQKVVSIFAGNNYENAPADERPKPTPAFKLEGNSWTDVTHTLIRPDNKFNLVSPYLASSQFIPIPSSQTDPTTRYIIDNTQLSEVVFRLWARNADESFSTIDSSGLSSSSSITVIESGASRHEYPLIRIGVDYYLFGGWLGHCVFFPLESSNTPVAISAVSLWKINKRPVPQEIAKVLTPGAMLYGPDSELVNILLTLRVTDEKLNVGVMNLPGLDSQSAQKFQCKDINGDGLTDLIMPRMNNSPQIFMGKPDGGFSLVSQNLIPPIRPPFNQSILSDFNGDKFLDILYLPFGVKLDPKAQMPWEIKTYLGTRILK